ncbi:hypothetical protein PGN35_018150 [Nodosilinea sp. PGN35]|uniref:hypothetical protein n=1 Tax=Nodosilinea sp. PGN35 TaxID=3020489 RepID=UPI0023B2D4B4|nr:hypothetical protein [Nodosilinea sp. TSF1-S3]MDF0364749.1 hypothetical protein [Nodosilinea sp. TSF1-S3]
MNLPPSLSSALYCFRSPQDANQFYYLPGDPVPQRDSRGNPAVSLMATSDFAMLQVSSQWRVTDSQLAALKADLQSQTAIAADALRLESAPVQIEAVELRLTTSTGEPEVLATSKSSGYAPFSAVFSVTLNAEQKAQAIAALGGRQDLLLVSYLASVDLPLAGQVEIEGEVATDLRELGPQPTAAAVRERVENAIARGRLTLTETFPDHTPADLKQRTLDQAKDRAIELLLQMAETPKTSRELHLYTKAYLEETTAVALERTADISTWFPSGKGLEHLQLIGS